MQMGAIFTFTISIKALLKLLESKSMKSLFIVSLKIVFLWKKKSMVTKMTGDPELESMREEV